MKSDESRAAARHRASHPRTEPSRSSNLLREDPQLLLDGEPVEEGVRRGHPIGVIPVDGDIGQERLVLPAGLR